MTERPIIFNGDMVRAILSGQKTQARRPFSCHNTFFGRIGDRLWVRETFAEHPQFNEIAYRKTSPRQERSIPMRWPHPSAARHRHCQTAPKWCRMVWN